MVKRKAAPSESSPPNMAKGHETHDAIELSLKLRAMRGDLKAISLLNKRPKQDNRKSLDFGPLETSKDLVRAQTLLLQAAARGEVSVIEAKKMGEQVDFLGQALERDALSKKIDELFDAISKTREQITHRSIEKQVNVLMGEVKTHIKSSEESWDDFIKRHGPNAEEVLIMAGVVTYIALLAGMEFRDILDLGRDQHLPRSLQDIHDMYRSLNKSEIEREKPTKRTLYKKFYPPDRWTPDNWACTCDNASTLWVESDLKFPDHIQIYCDACHKLAGWGTDAEFDRAYDQGRASWVERSEKEIIEKLNPSPVEGVKAYLKAKKIFAAVEYSNEDGGTDDIALKAREEAA